MQSGGLQHTLPGLHPGYESAMNDKAAHRAALSFNGSAYFSTKARSIR